MAAAPAAFCALGDQGRVDSMHPRTRSGGGAS
jgi:hypothetical protein